MRPESRLQAARCNRAFNFVFIRLAVCDGYVRIAHFCRRCSGLFPSVRRTAYLRTWLPTIFDPSVLMTDEGRIVAEYRDAGFHDRLPSAEPPSCPFEAHLCRVCFRVAAHQGRPSRMVYFAVFLDLAQRARCAAAIFSRASGLKVRRAGVLWANSAGLKVVALLREAFFAGRPGLRPPDRPAGSAFACWSRAISASIARIMSSVFMNPLNMRSTSGALPTPGYNRRFLFSRFWLAMPGRVPLRAPRCSVALSGRHNGA
jgi:hypothetical protein